MKRSREDEDSDSTKSSKLQSVSDSQDSSTQREERAGDLGTQIANISAPERDTAALIVEENLHEASPSESKQGQLSNSGNLETLLPASSPIGSENNPTTEKSDTKAGSDLDGEGDEGEDVGLNEDLLKQKTNFVSETASSESFANQPTLSVVSVAQPSLPKKSPVLSRTRVKCQECESLISVNRYAEEDTILFECPVCCANVAFDHRHSPTIIPYQDRSDNFACHTWSANQLMVFIQQIGLPHLVPYLAHQNIDGRAMMELFRGELRQRIGVQTEEQAQALLGALNILRLGEGVV